MNSANERLALVYPVLPCHVAEIHICSQQYRYISSQRTANPSFTSTRRSSEWVGGVFSINSASSLISSPPSTSNFLVPSISSSQCCFAGRTPSTIAERCLPRPASLCCFGHTTLTSSTSPFKKVDKGCAGDFLELRTTFRSSSSPEIFRLDISGAMAFNAAAIYLRKPANMSDRTFPLTRRLFSSL